ncbi:MAG: hypothetical protein KatS3mg077_0995 [Candidatus Binatia bacterium]|nr:MAG: hypothetical protein KatS3mg077_0995 [Candidatus Binatia bacterium]
MTAKKKLDLKALKKVYIEVGGKRVPAWEPKDPALRSLGRWTDPEALLRRMYEQEHPEDALEFLGPGRQWQTTWKGRFNPALKQKNRRAA